LRRCVPEERMFGYHSIPFISLEAMGHNWARKSNRTRSDMQAL
jgi:hypothetical protein